MVQKKLPLINSAHGSETRNIINEVINAINDRGLEILSESSFLTWLDKNNLNIQSEVQSVSDLPADDALNTIRGVLDDNKLYIKRDFGWVAYQTIDLNKINKVERRVDRIEVNVMDFGAVGDGITDDTEAIKLASAAAERKVLKFPKTTKEYLISDEIWLKECKVISDGATIKQTATGKNGLRGRDLGSISIDDLKVVGLGAKDGSESNEFNILLERCNNVSITKLEVDETRGQASIRLVDCHTGAIERNKINKFTYAAIQIIGDCQNITVRDNDIRHSLARSANGGGSYGVHISALASSTNYPKNISVINNNVEDIKAWDAFNVHGGENIYIIDNTAKDVRIGIDASLHYYDASSILKNLIVRGNILSGTSASVNGNTASGIMVHGHENAIAENVIIDGNIVDGFNKHGGGESTSQMGGIRAGKINGLKVYNNTTNKNKCYGIRLTDSVKNFEIYSNEVKDSENRCIYLGFGNIEFGKVHDNNITQTGDPSYPSVAGISCGSPGSHEVYEYSNTSNGVKKYQDNTTAQGLFKQEFMDQNPANFGNKNVNWNIGETVKNANPVSGSYSGWICLEAGIPGVWKGYGLIQN